MEVRGKVVVVTGGGNGIGAALARACAAAGAAGVVVGDLEAAAAAAVADGLGVPALALACDVGNEAGVQALVAAARARFGRIDLYCSNAGFLGQTGGFEVDDGVWNGMWNVHVMAHVWAARAVVPGMLEQGGGGFLITASAAGLLNIVESAPYAASKHAAVGFAEWLRIAHARRGLTVTCLCPQFVRTRLIAGGAGATVPGEVITPEQVATVALEALAADRFLALPHPEVAGYFQAKAQDPERWLGAMGKLYERTPR